MSAYGQQQGQKDAENGKSPADMQNAHWKEKQDYNAAYVNEKAKQNK